MFFKPAQAYSKVFTLTDSTGALVDADSLPTATAYRNGTADAGFVLAVANISTGKYKATGTVPAYTQDDVVEVIVDATIATVATAESVDRFHIETRIDAAITSRPTLASMEAGTFATTIGLLKKHAENKKAVSKSGATWSLVIYDNDGTTPLLTKALKDKDGAEITDLAAGIIAQELAGS